MKLLRDKVKRDTYMASKISGMISRGDLRNDHPQQRKSGLWDNEVRDNFIVTVLRNEDFDPIKICEQLTENGVVLWLIDGLQRCTTIENYKIGKFALGKNINPSIIEYQEVRRDENEKIVRDENGNTVYDIISYDLRGKSYAQLPEKLKEDFDNCPVEVVKHLDCSDEEVGRHIVRYNSSIKMNVAQKTITYMCNVARDVKRVSGHAFFSDCANFSDTKDKNGTIDKIVNESIMGLNFFDQWKRNATQLGKFLNEYATKDMFKDFEGNLDRLYNVVTPATGKLFNEKNALIWFMLFDKFTKTGLADEKFGEFLNNFSKVENIKVTLDHTRKPKGTEESNSLSFAEIDTCNSTKDKGIIEDKLYILETLMNEYLHIDTNVEEVKEEELGCEVDSVVDSAEDICSEDNIESPLEFVRENVDSELTDEDVELFEDMVDDCVKIDSPIYTTCRAALIAIMAYACSKDQDMSFEDWIKKYESNNLSFSPDQKVNYAYMKRDFDKFVAV